MKSLQTILEGLPCDVRGSRDVAIEDVVFDSRKVSRGALFVALKGVHQDGHAFIDAAVKSGARAVIAQEEAKASGATLVRVSDSFKALAYVARRFWDNPSSRLRMIGITGTNGKTTSTYLIESIFRAMAWPTGVMGTIEYRFGKDRIPAPNTTPFATEVQRFLAKIAAGGGSACVMEVSSHALELGRVDGVEFDVGIFTNLTQDHLDFHKTMDAYAAAKAKLFASLNPSSAKPFPKCAVLNADDPWAEKMAAAVQVPVLRFRLATPADFYAKNIVCDATGSRFVLHTPDGEKEVRLPLLGDYNILNALAAAGAAHSQRVPLETIVQGLEAVRHVPGRVERIAAPGGFTVVVDYAHTDDALQHVMAALRKLKPAHLITVFGCGGDRDRTKRPLMGQVAAEMSDEVIVTSDNPRSEDPERITLDIEVGVRRVRPDHYQILLDREAAIAKAFALARSGDIVLIAGKGHENYQILRDRTVPFDDREVAKRLLQLPK